MSSSESLSLLVAVLLLCGRGGGDGFGFGFGFGFGGVVSLSRCSWVSVLLSGVRFFFDFARFFFFLVVLRSLSCALMMSAVFSGPITLWRMR